MKIELINRISIEDYNEQVFYTPLENKKAEASRRDFLKCLVIAPSGFLVPSLLNKPAHAAFPLVLIPAGITALKLFYDFMSQPQRPVVVNNNINNNPPKISISDADSITCKIHLSNGGHKTAQGIIDCRLDHQLEPDLKYEMASRKKVKESIPPGYTDEYQVDLGDASSNTGRYLFTGKTQKNRKKIKYSVKA